MLTALSIRDVVLIDRLDLTFNNGLCVLTGETGAGKSILLDALGLALGARADSGLLRHGAERAVVSAAFTLPAGHEAQKILAEKGLDSGDETLTLRRILGADGRGRAFINDQPASVGLLREIGQSLVEIQGQFEPRGLIDPATHRGLVDGFARLGGQPAAVREAFGAWRAAAHAREDAARSAAAAERDRDFLEYAVAELDTLDAQPGDEDSLAETRTRLMHAEKIVEAMNASRAALTGENDIEDGLRLAGRHLGQVADKAGGALDAAIAALERAALETADALSELEAAAGALDPDQSGLEAVEERLFALKAAARKHGVDVDGLPALREELAGKLALALDSSGTVEKLREAEDAARAKFLAGAEKLSDARRDAGRRLEKAVNAELPPLKLDKARLKVAIERLDEESWTAHGIDRIAFLASTNPGTPEAPLGKIASGGELSRFMLALKVAAVGPGGAPTLIFDEVDANVGGATADAVGERLARLAGDVQVLVVTHSPQVAARGSDHLLVEKGANGGASAVTRVVRLDDGERREEVARMLSGAAITDEARAAAGRLLEGAGA